MEKIELIYVEVDSVIKYKNVPDIDNISSGWCFSDSKKYMNAQSAVCMIRLTNFTDGIFFVFFLYFENQL